MFQLRVGFTLFELIITISFILLALIPLLNALSSTLAVSSESHSDIMAINLAQTKMEEIRSLAYAGIASEAKAAVSSFPAFQREVIVTTPNADLKKVVVLVYWTPSGGVEEIVSFETYIANF
ncbi:MAG: hypothetical protein KJ732_05520 [Candidatus Margulisbacteria bacterium]|nr:hypothetical protein [Candidatus Margulisiibacteriota bacterium]